MTDSAAATGPVPVFEAGTFSHAGREHEVYRAGSGPAAVSERTRQGLCVLGLRFGHDMGSPAQRFQTLRRELGAGFEAIEIDSSPGNPHGIGTRAHSVLTVELVDEPGHPTRAALDRVMTFLDERLRPQSHS